MFHLSVHFQWSLVNKHIDKLPSFKIFLRSMFNSNFKSVLHCVRKRKPTCVSEPWGQCRPSHVHGLIQQGQLLWLQQSFSFASTSRTKCICPLLDELWTGIVAIVAAAQLGHWQRYVRTPDRTFVKLEIALGNSLNAMHLISCLYLHSFPRYDYSEMWPSLERLCTLPTKLRGT
jgi:hypothetical protein